MDDLFVDMERLPAEDLKIIEMLSFTDIVFIGGDGLSHQFIRNISQSKFYSHFKDLAYGYLPGGSYCATACDVKGRIENYACTNIIWGETSKRQMLKVRDVINEKTFYTMCLFYGYVSDMVTRADRHRRCLGRYWYHATMAKDVFCSRNSILMFDGHLFTQNSLLKQPDLDGKVWRENVNELFVSGYDE